ncbi:MAG: hypothetical protein IJY15_06440, partial [Thermoguttaceae bacterium]|nr:hypothetical protein [Thermoguttaceae bacterium]
RGYAPKTDVETGPVVLRISQAATARLRERVQAFPFDSLRCRLPFRRGKIGSGGTRRRLVFDEARTF